MEEDYYPFLKKTKQLYYLEFIMIIYLKEDHLFCADSFLKLMNYFTFYHILVTLQ